MFYVKTVKNGGASSKFLKMGDRLLMVLFLKKFNLFFNKKKERNFKFFFQIDDIELKSLEQLDVTTILKRKSVGDTIIVKISRILETPKDSVVEDLPENKFSDFEKELINLIHDDERELIKFNIALNDSPSAGTIFIFN